VRDILSETQNPKNSKNDHAHASDIDDAHFLLLSASSTIILLATLFGGTSAANVLATAAVFVDSTANALCAASAGAAGTAVTLSPVLLHSLSAGSTSARAYRLRVGPDAGTFYTNGLSGGRQYGGVAKITFTVIEVLP
jgi:hypothetical protein